MSDIAFNPQKSILAAGTAAGHVVMWRRVGSSTSSSSDWEPLKAYNVSSPVLEMCWAESASGLLTTINRTSRHTETIRSEATGNRDRSRSFQQVSMTSGTPLIDELIADLSGTLRLVEIDAQSHPDFNQDIPSGGNLHEFSEIAGIGN